MNQCTCAGGDEAAHYKHESYCDTLNPRSVAELEQEREDEIEALRGLLLTDWRELLDEDALDGFVTIDTIEGDDRRWSRNVEVITEGPSGQLYRWSYEHGLTEYQEHELCGEHWGPDWVERVTRHEEVKTTTVVTYKSE